MLGQPCLHSLAALPELFHYFHDTWRHQRLSSPARNLLEGSCIAHGAARHGRALIKPAQAAVGSGSGGEFKGEHQVAQVQLTFAAYATSIPSAKSTAEQLTAT